MHNFNRRQKLFNHFNLTIIIKFSLFESFEVERPIFKSDYYGYTPPLLFVPRKVILKISKIPKNNFFGIQILLFWMLFVWDTEIQRNLVRKLMSRCFS